MQIVRNLLMPPSHAKSAAIALGNFDGLHAGHHAILEETLKHAQTIGIPAGVMSFEPHPREFFNPAAPSLRLMRLKEKIQRLRAMGFDFLFLPRFNKTLASTGAEDFIRHYLVDALEVRVIVTGENFHFGAKRSGNHELLARASYEHGFAYHAIAPVCSDAGMISSSAIRALLAEGKLAEIPHLLGRPYSISGRVMHGDKRGRSIGFPTANISLRKLFTPRLGVYVVSAEVSGKKYKGVANIGLRPTFGGIIPRAEIHLFDFSDDIYGKEMRVELRSFLRNEKPFASLDALKEQITRDVQDAKNDDTK
jgi:riboflavin kinase/FMN adenylyltransferase